MNLDQSLLLASKGFLYMAGTMLPILNPPGAAPIFLSMTTGASNATRRMLSKRVAINTFIMLSIAALTGGLILSFFGISLSVVRIAGGFLVVSCAWSLLNAKEVDGDTSEAYAEQLTLEKAIKSAFFPLTFPIICGPGSISAVITVGAALQSESSAQIIPSYLGAFLGIIAVAATIFFSLRFAPGFMAFLGNTGASIFMRLSAFLLLCIGLQIMWIGIHELIIDTYTDLQQDSFLNQGIISTPYTFNTTPILTRKLS